MQHLEGRFCRDLIIFIHLKILRHLQSSAKVPKMQALLHVDRREQLHEPGFKGDRRQSAYGIKSIAVVVRNLVATILS